MGIFRFHIYFQRVGINYYCGWAHFLRYTLRLSVWTSRNPTTSFPPLSIPRTYFLNSTWILHELLCSAHLQLHSPFAQNSLRSRTIHLPGTLSGSNNRNKVLKMNFSRTNPDCLFPHSDSLVSPNQYFHACTTLLYACRLGIPRSLNRPVMTYSTSCFILLALLIQYASSFLVIHLHPLIETTAVDAGIIAVSEFRKR